MKRRQKKKIATNPRLWRRLVSATFLVGPAGITMTNYQMLSLGIPSKRIEQMHATLPLLGELR